MIIVDFDDFYDQNTRMDILFKIKTDIPNFKVTLFTIPGRTTTELIQSVLSSYSDWIDLVPHGWMHESNYECLHWSEGDMQRCLDLCETKGFVTKGFKAPGWQISDGCYKALLKRGYWVADQHYNTFRRPKELPVYLLDHHKSCSIHGHLGHLNGHNDNEIEAMIPVLGLYRNDEFKFVRDVVCSTIS